MAPVKWRIRKTCDYSIEKAGHLGNTSLLLGSLEVLQYGEYWNRVPIGRPKDWFLVSWGDSNSRKSESKQSSYGWPLGSNQVPCKQGINSLLIRKDPYRQTLKCVSWNVLNFGKLAIKTNYYTHSHCLKYKFGKP